MIMPETSVYEDDGIVFAKNDIRSSWQCPVINPITKSFRKKPLSDSDFIFGVSTSNSCHHAASGIFIYNVHFSRLCMMVYNLLRGEEALQGR